ncbi:response regulator [Humisphaera borealis]|uniref:Response regulator n=1 Tax=Humisphaera borealis TaxID=2807512 RepID=A0A7M2WYS1_9BACT|nr:response regulator [Humisphaera borealis]QOV90569.1 response regulator [Humisphaera borealis]
MLEHRKGNAVPSGESDSARCHPGPERSRAGCTRPRILLVEDDDLSARMMAKLLEDEQFECRYATDYRSALRTASEWIPDFLVCDIDLQSRRDGCDVLRSMRTAYQTIQGISVSGLEFGEARARSEQGGFALHLSKPIDAARLISSLRSLMLSPPRASGRSPAASE